MDNPKQPAPDSASVLLRGASPPEAGVTPWRDSTFTVRLPLARARRLGDPLCRCS
jgi:hypothetical protein